MLKIMGKRIFDELWSGWTRNEAIFLAGLLAVQLIVLAGQFMADPTQLSDGWVWLSSTGGVCGVICAVEVAKGKLSSYFWGTLQVVSYLSLSIHHVLYGEVLLNGFFLTTQGIGFVAWQRHMDADASTPLVFARRLRWWQWAIVPVAVLVIWLSLGGALQLVGSHQPFMDSLTTTFSLSANLLFVCRMSEQWLFWIIVDVLEVILWVRAGDPGQIALWSCRLVNAVYGYLNWRQLAKGHAQKAVAA
ncbi:nicotinamide riboside transporter PnuC [Lacticaseibacillus baoqingensis]|uniref:Nicotinamide riboside transporter PnuC n=1 Tax=Lacticaseibacillus baoqingensis TaxID=2486013 RepID=A0ABW4E110_9LACO|nr:nicotinamide riboside transporter PnuC [Lacticaseibacillus baoqingensis]